MTRAGEVFAAAAAVTLVSLVAVVLYASSSFAPGTTTTATTTSSSTAISTSSTALATSFSYSPNGCGLGSCPIQVLSVAAKTTRDNTTGKVYLTLQVAFKNAGGAQVYIIKGCGSSLSATIAPTPVITESTGPRCLCAELIAPLSPGDSTSATTPGCWSGVSYLVVHPGTISANLTLSYWGGENLQNPGSTSISATITVP